MTRNCCLITGGAGFIGANLVRRLSEHNLPIRVLDNLSFGNAACLNGLKVELIAGDIRDKQFVEQVMEGVGTVIHLAAHANINDSRQELELNFEVNVKGTLNLLQASVKHGVDRFLFASTGAVFGETELPVNGETAPHPISFYGASKLACEGYCSAFWRSSGLKTVCLRITNSYGPFSYHKSSVIAKLFRQVQSGSEITIYGDGSQTRDFLHVKDLCQAVIAAMEIELPYGEALQLGSGQETSINHLVALVRQVVGEEHFPPVRHVPPPFPEVKRNFASIERAQKYLGFFPKTDLRRGLHETWRWFQQEYHPS
jgi:UDP-glucose 4-epimerase